MQPSSTSNSFPSTSHHSHHPFIRPSSTSTRPLPPLSLGAVLTKSCFLPPPSALARPPRQTLEAFSFLITLPRQSNNTITQLLTLSNSSRRPSKDPPTAPPLPTTTRPTAPLLCQPTSINPLALFFSFLFCPNHTACNSHLLPQRSSPSHDTTTSSPAQPHPIHYTGTWTSPSSSPGQLNPFAPLPCPYSPIKKYISIYQSFQLYVQIHTLHCPIPLSCSSHSFSSHLPSHDPLLFNLKA